MDGMALRLLNNLKDRPIGSLSSNYLYVVLSIIPIHVCFC